MEIRGYKYQPWVDQTTEVVKIFHDVHTPTGEVVDMDWSPYNTPTEDDFRLWLDLGMPRRRGTGPICRIELLAQAEERWGVDFVKELGAI